MRAPELEFESNFIWLAAERTRGWVSSHIDIVDKFSAARRPTDRRAYTHKLNFELDTSVSVFNGYPRVAGSAGLSWRARSITSRLACPRPATAQMVDVISTMPPRGPFRLCSFFLSRHSKTAVRAASPVRLIEGGLLRDTSLELADTMPEPELTGKVVRIARTVAGYAG